MRSTFRFALIPVALAFASLASPAWAQSSAPPPPADPPPVITAPPNVPPASAPPQAAPLPQAGAPQAASPQGPSAPALPRLPTPGETIGSIGRFIDQSISNVGAGIRGAGDAVGGASSTAGELAKGVGDAAGTVARLPLSSTVSGWQACPSAANGAPDCEAASVALCQTRGFKAGKSIDITSAQKCPAVLWLEKRQPKEGECKNESFVSKALCQ
jgi:hypothetical protein